MLVEIIIISCIALWGYFKFIGDPINIRQLYFGKTPGQKEVIRYFLINGRWRKKWSDEEYDNYVRKNIPDLRQRAMDKIGLDEDQLKEVEPVHFEKYLFDDDSLHKKGMDNHWRSSKLQILWLFFSDTEVYLYQVIQYLDDGTMQEHMAEYFYKDITKFSISRETEEITIDEETMMSESYKLMIAVPGDSFCCTMSPDENIENSIQGMMAKLREVKQS